jgi:hypothetical protein
MNDAGGKVSHGPTKAKVPKMNKDSNELSRLRCQQKLSKARKVRDQARTFFKSENGEFSFEPSEALSSADRETIFTDTLYDEFEEHYRTATRLPRPCKRMKQNILKDLIRNRLECSGNRYTEEAHRLTYDILQEGGVKALAAVRREIPLPSRQAEINFKPAG